MKQVRYKWVFMGTKWNFSEYLSAQHPMELRTEGLDHFLHCVAGAKIVIHNLCDDAPFPTVGEVAGYEGAGLGKPLLFSDLAVSMGGTSFLFL